MRRPFYILGFLLLCIMPSVSFAQAEEFNERVSGSTDSLYLLAATWMHAYQDAHESEKGYSSLAGPRKDLQRYIDDQIRAFKKPVDVEGADGVRKAILALYEFEKKFIANGFTPFEQLTATSADGDVLACRERLTAEGRPEKELLLALNKERKDFASKNGIDLAPPPAAPKPIYRRPAPTRKAPAGEGRQSAPPPEAKAPPEPRRQMSSGNPRAKMEPADDGQKEKPKGKTDSEKEDSEEEE